MLFVLVHSILSYVRVDLLAIAASAYNYYTNLVHPKIVPNIVLLGLALDHHSFLEFGRDNPGLVIGIHVLYHVLGSIW